MAWVTRLISELDSADERAKTVAEGLTPLQLNWKPGLGSWSVGQCLEHLRATNQVLIPAIAASLNRAPLGPAEDITPGWFGRWFLRNYIEPSPDSKKARAPRKIAPASEVELDILGLFLTSNLAARELVRRASGYDVNRIRYQNPFIPLLRFTVGTGLLIVPRHQHRHLLQAERVKQAAEFPGPERNEM